MNIVRRDAKTAEAFPYNVNTVRRISSVVLDSSITLFLLVAD